MEDLNPEGDGTEPPRPLHDAAPGSLHADSPATVQQQQGQEQVKEDPHEQQQQQQQHQMQDRIPLVCGETRGFYLPTMQGVECHCTACEQRAALLKRNVLITPSEFERHAGLSHIKQWRHTVKVVEEAEAGGSAASCRRPLGDWLLVHGGDAGNGDATSSGEGLQSASGGGGQQQLKPAHALLFGRVKAAPSQYHHQQQQAVPTPLGLPILPERRLQPTVAPLPNLPPLITRRQPAGQPPPARARTRPRPQLSPSQVVLASGGVLRSASTDSALHSPAGRAWMAAEPRQHDVRVGPVYQASVPDARGAPSGAGLAGEAGEQQAGLPGPTESVAMGLATEEKERSSLLPHDATADVWIREVADQVRVAATGRAQRQRRPPTWMADSVDPGLALGMRPVLPRGDEGEQEELERWLAAGGLREEEHARTERRRREAALAALTEQLHGALRAGSSPELVTWRLPSGAASQDMQLTLRLGDVTFTGSLAAQLPEVPESPPASSDDLQQMAASALASGRSSAPPSPSLAQAQLAEHHHQQQQPVPSRTGISAAAATPGSRGGGGGVCAQEGESAPDRALERRMQAEALMARLERDGAPPGARCALCGGEEQARIPEERLGLGWRGATADGLGHMLFVRTSAVNHAWVHHQCAAWSPECYDPEGTGHLEGIRDAILRGRMLRCKVCRQKGATLGCFKRTCKASYHLPCARDSGCFLQIKPYCMTCPGHVGDVPGTRKRFRSQLAAANAAAGAGAAEDQEEQPQEPLEVMDSEDERQMRLEAEDAEQWGQEAELVQSLRRRRRRRREPGGGGSDSGGYGGGGEGRAPTTQPQQMHGGALQPNEMGKLPEPAGGGATPRDSVPVDARPQPARVGIALGLKQQQQQQPTQVPVTPAGAALPIRPPALLPGAAMAALAVAALGARPPGAVPQGARPALVLPGGLALNPAAAAALSALVKGVQQQQQPAAVGRAAPAAQATAPAAPAAAAGGLAVAGGGAQAAAPRPALSQAQIQLLQAVLLRQRQIAAAKAQQQNQQPGGQPPPQQAPK